MNKEELAKQLLLGHKCETCQKYICKPVTESLPKEGVCDKWEKTTRPHGITLS